MGSILANLKLNVSGTSGLFSTKDHQMKLQDQLFELQISEIRNSNIEKVLRMEIQAMENVLTYGKR